MQIDEEHLNRLYTRSEEIIAREKETTRTVCQRYIDRRIPIDILKSAVDKAYKQIARHQRDKDLIDLIRGDE